MEEMNGKVPGKGQATASLVLGIISAVFGVLGMIAWVFLWFGIVSSICGIVGLVLAGQSKKAGFSDRLRTSGFVLSLVGLIFGAIGTMEYVSCVACLSGL